jgi:P-type Ca2+ transporter type 2C
LVTEPALIGITGFSDPLRDGVREAGVRATVCTRDIALAAGSIAQQCDLYTSDSIIMQGPHFLSLQSDVLNSIAPRLQVPARSSPEDERQLVDALKECGNFVCVTGYSTEDGPAPKTAAHVGFFMGITGTEIPKEASDTILMDDIFSSIVKAIMRGQCVNDAVRKFLQFHISNVTTVVITFITALASSEEEGALGAARLLWINTVGTFTALALATNPASPVLLNCERDKKTDPSFTVDMLRQIAGQSTYQNAMVLILKSFGARFFRFYHSDEPSPQKHNNAVVHNAFGFAQIFDPSDSRGLGRKLNFFKGTLKNWYFMTTTFIGS